MIFFLFPSFLKTLESLTGKAIQRLKPLKKSLTHSESGFSFQINSFLTAKIQIQVTQPPWEEDRITSQIV